MADTTLTQTGAQVQADLDKVEGLANIKTIGSGLSLSAGGELSISGSNGGSLTGYDVTYDFDHLPYSSLSIYCVYIDTNNKLSMQSVYAHNNYRYNGTINNVLFIRIQINNAQINTNISGDLVDLLSISGGSDSLYAVLSNISITPTTGGGGSN